MTSRIRIPTFDAEVVFVHDVGVPALKRYAAKKWNFDLQDQLDDDEDFAGIAVEVDNLVWLVYVPDTSSQDIVWLARTLSHEANHVTLQLMEKVGVEDDETVCYTQDNLLGELLRRCLKHQNKKKTS